MPPRLSKRQQREQDEIMALKADLSTPGVHEDSDSEDDIEIRPAIAAFASTSGRSGFAALLIGDDTGDNAEQDDDDEEAPAHSKAKKSKKKKKKTGASKDVSPAVTSPPLKKPASTKKDKAKSKSNKDEIEDFDKALAELSMKYPNTTDPNASAASGSASKSLATLLAVSVVNLDSEAEMRRYFGAKVVSASRGSSPSAPRQTQQQQARSQLTRPRPTWWPAKLREGLTTRPLVSEEKPSLDGEKWWTVEYSKKYRGLTRAFVSIVMAGDPNGLFNLLQKMPWHADTLLQLSEVYRHQEEWSQAVDFVERALFAYERSFIGAFTFTSGLNRLDFDRVENRPFYLAIHRQITDLQRKGSVRTAFEFARLLLSLDPHTDPHGALFHLDLLAIKANMFEWLLGMWDHHLQLQNFGKLPPLSVNVTLLPGWGYARALALRAQEDIKKDSNYEGSTNALAEAITSFPSVVPLLADKADINLPGEIRSSSVMRIFTDNSGLSDANSILQLLSHLYAQRSAALWRDSTLQAWFRSTVISTFPSLTVTNAPTSEFVSLYASSENLRFSVYRHIIVLESTLRSLMGFIPRTVLSARQLACDPLPPPTKVSEYDDQFFEGAEDVLGFQAPRSRRQEARILERLIPDAALRDQLVGFFNANPMLAQRFPGGVIQFAQIAEQFPEEIIEGIMAAQAMGGGDAFANQQGAGVAGGEMPGAFVHDEPVEENRVGEEPDEDEDEDEDEGVAMLPLRAMRNFMNRLWGAGGNADEDESSDDDAGPVPVHDGNNHE